MKKIILLFLSLAIVLSFTACSQNSGNADTDTAQSTEQNADDTTASSENSDNSDSEESDSVYSDLSGDSSGDSSDSDNQSAAEETSKSSKKNKALLTDIQKALEDLGIEVAEDEITAEAEDGSFEYKVETLDVLEMYSMEQSDELQEKAEKNAESFVSSISGNYSYDITYESTEVEQIGGDTENGIDSVIYNIKYTNEQNQQLLIKADSTASIYYVYCTFTW